MKTAKSLKHEINEGTMPPITIWSNRKTRVSHCKRFTSALGANQNRCDRSKGDAHRHQHSQNCPNVAGGLDGANLANGRADFTGRGRFFKKFIAALADSTATWFDNGWTGKTLKTKTMNTSKLKYNTSLVDFFKNVKPEKSTLRMLYGCTKNCSLNYKDAVKRMKENTEELRNICEMIGAEIQLTNEYDIITIKYQP